MRRSVRAGLAAVSMGTVVIAGCGGSSGMLRSWSTYEQLHSLLQEWAK